MSTRVSAISILMALLACPAGWAEDDPSLVAQYTFEEGPSETVRDWSGSGNNGKNLGAEYVDLGDGKGFALRFGDAEGYVDCGNDPSLDLTGALTIEVWLYPETYRVKGGIAGLVGKSLSSYMLSCEGTGSWFFIAQDSMRTDCAASTTVKTWNHIVVTFDGKFSRAYTDGREVKVQESMFSKIDHGGTFSLRYPIVWGGKVEPTVTLMMDDVRVYNRAMSHAEVSAHYKKEGKVRGKDLSRFEKVKLESHVSVVAREVILEADVSGMELGMFAPAATLMLELVEKTSGKAVARREVTELPESGKTDWSVSTNKLQAGDYEFRAEVADKDGEPYGVTTSIDVTVSSETPAWIGAYEGQKRLNNLVAELLSVEDGQKEADKEYAFNTVRDGWVFVSSTAQIEGEDRVVVAIGEESVIVHSRDADETIEAMRYLSAGPHQLTVRCEGFACSASLVVRAIPEMVYAELGYEPTCWFKGYGPYTWEYLEKIGIMDNVNVILQRASKPENVEHIENWRKRGKKLLYYYNVSWLLSKEGALTGDSAYNEWSTKAAFSSVGYYGLILDELSGHSYVEQYPAFTEAVRRIAENEQFKDRVFYTYCTGLYGSEASRAYTDVILDAGYKLVEEKYLFEQPTEASARRTMNDQLRMTMLRYQDHFEDCATKMIMNLGYISIPQQTQCVSTEADFKVFMDMQMHMLANDPVFLGLYGVMWYHSSYADEELLRWAAKLYRHYCIEGRRERLTDDPYELPHIVNGDFEGIDEWTIEPAEEGSVSVKRAFGYGQMQGRMTLEGQGDNVLVTRRSATRPNRISQPIRELRPGRLYALKMFVMDYGDFRKGKSLEKVHHFNVAIEGGERIAESSLREVYTNEKQVRPFTGENRLNITFCRVVFRAQRETGKLTFSDWLSEDDSGDPPGQELAFNFVSVEPYLEEGK